VTNRFQNDNDPLRRRHLGLDIAAREGAPVLAAGDGVVIFADWDQYLGWLVVIEHGYGFTTRYGHNSSLRVERGDHIRRGQIIALVGSTGRSSAPHLHYEIWMNRTPVDPRSYLPDVLRWDDLLGYGGYVG
jgi:murein DD-endopeptidase MepM/ murein hydrolase activator NlpD